MAHLLSFSLDDSTPQISYWPRNHHTDVPNPAVGWTTFLSDSSLNPALGDAAYGTSYHITSKDAATVSFDFHGTGFQLLGKALSAEYSVLLDDELIVLPTSSNQGDTLAETSGLPNRKHSVTLVVHKTSPNSLIAFDKAIIISPSTIDRIPSGSSSRKLPCESAQFIGRWSTEKRGLRESQYNYHHSQAAGDRILVSFRGPHVFLSGIASPSAGIFSVTLDRNVTTTLSANSRYTNPDTLLYYATGLDSQATHELEITNIDGSAMYLKTDDLIFAPYESRGYPPLKARAGGQRDSAESSGYPAGTVAALVLAGVLIFLIISSSLFYIFVYRPRRRCRAQDRRNAPEELKFDTIRQSPHFRDSSSRRRGFENWRREVELGLGLGALANLGLVFRHSSSEGGQPRGHTYDGDDDYADDAPLSSKSDTSSTSSRARKTAAKGKTRAFISSWSRRSKSPGSYSLDPPRSTSNHSHRSDASMTHDSLYFAPIYKGKLMQPPTEQITYRLSGSESHPYSGIGGAIRPLPPIAIPSVNVQTPTTEGGSPPSFHPAVDRYSVVHNRSLDVNRASHLSRSDAEQGLTEGNQGLLFPQSTGQAVSNRDSHPVNELDSFKATQDALRALSPRTSEVIPRIIRTSGASRSQNRPDSRNFLDVSSKKLPQPPSGLHFSTTAQYPSLEGTSVDILDLRDDSVVDETSKNEELTNSPSAEPGQGNSRGKRGSGLSVRFQEQVQNISDSGAQQGQAKLTSVVQKPLPNQPAVLKPFVKSRHLAGPTSSFLDLDSSSSGGSSRSPSNGSSLAPSRREVSRWSNTTESHSLPSIGQGVGSRWSASTPVTQELSQQITITRPTHSQNGSSDSAAMSPSSTGNPFPYPVSLPPSPHHPAHILQLQQSRAATAANNNRSLGLQVSGTGSGVYLQPTELTSPTDSIPMTISEMHFRHSFSEDIHDRESSGSHLPPHPRLPLGEADEDDDRRRALTGASSHAFLVQRILGQNGTGPNTPLSPFTPMDRPIPKPPSGSGG